MDAKNPTKKKTQLSVIMRDAAEKLNRSGVNCIRYEANASGGGGVSASSSKSGSSSQHLDRLFTAGRDAVIRVYTNLVASTTTTTSTSSNLLTVVTPAAASASTTGGVGSSSSSSLNRSASGDVMVNHHHNNSISSSSSGSSHSNTTTNIDRYYQMSMSHHSDWVNDIVVCRTTKTVFSASSDTTVKIWNSNKGVLLNTLRLHKDYVKCLSYAKDKQLLASAGFDKNIFIWDISKGVALNPNGLDVKSICDSKYSIYSLAMTSNANILACGSPENCIRLWDPRSCAKVMKLKGHTHNIRYLVLNRDGTQCLSASSDHTVRLWSLGQQRCISTIEVHTDGVWTLCVNEAFNKVYSGGKDCKVYETDLRSQDDSVLICEESTPVLSLDFGYEQESLWVSTTNSSLKNWGLKPPTAEAVSDKKNLQSSSSSRFNRNSVSGQQQNLTSASDKTLKPVMSTTSTTVIKNQQAMKQEVVNYSSSSSTSSRESVSSLSSSTSSLPVSSTVHHNQQQQQQQQQHQQLQPHQYQAINTQPVMVIPGTASIKQYHILNDKRFIVTKDTDDNVAVWDVLQARRIESLGKENYEQAIKVRQRFISIPNWFSVDLKLGVLTVNIDETEWQSAWINFKDMDTNHVRQSQHIDLSEARVNYGYIFLESVFKTCTFVNPSRFETCTNVVMPQSSNTTTTNTSTTNSSPTTINSSESGSSPSSYSTQSQSQQPGLLRFNIPEHTPVVFSEVAGRCLYRIEVRDMSRENEQQPLANVMPSWIVDALFGKTPPKFNRINFILNPYNANQIKLVNKDRLISYDLLQVKKVKEYVYSKILKLDQQPQQLNESTNTMPNQQQPVYNDTNNNKQDINSNSYDRTTANSSESSPSTAVASTTSKDTFANAQRLIELICSDQILNDPEMNLRTVKHLIWKGSGDLTILFRIKT